MAQRLIHNPTSFQDFSLFMKRMPVSKRLTYLILEILYSLSVILPQSQTEITLHAV